MHRLSLLLVFSSLLVSCDLNRVSSHPKSVLDSREIRGIVTTVDSNNSQVTVEILGCGKDLQNEWGKYDGLIKSFSVQSGDLNFLTVGRTFRAKSSTSNQNVPETLFLSDIWPDDRSERIRVNNVNRLLRRDTLSLGEGVIRSVGDTLPPFALYDQDAQVLTTDYFDGSVTVLNFIFTRCSIAEMCPASTLRMKKLQHLAKQTKVPHVKFLSITLDPEFDSPGVLKTYAQGYDLDESNFRLGTSTKSTIDDLTRQFGIFRKNKDDLPLDHTMRTLIINSKRQIIYQFPGSGWAVEDFLARLPEGV